MPGGLDEFVATDFEVWAAQRTVDQHERESPRADGRRGCAQCPPAGPCRQRAWAEQRLALAQGAAGS